jgi:DNA-binding MarR family transcriptional regulator
MRIDPSLEKTPAGSMIEAQLKSVIGYQLAQATVVTNQIFNDAIRRPHGLRMLEYTILALVCENPGVSPQRLAAALAVTAPSITNMVDRLAERGWVFREKSNRDGRRQYLHPTSTGREVKDAGTERVIDLERTTIDTLTPGEYELLLELLHKLGGARKTRKPPSRDELSFGGC